MKWIEALKIWNTEHNPGKWCVVKKGTAEYDAVKAIMAGGAAPKRDMKAEMAAAREKAIEVGKQKKEIRGRLEKATAKKRVLKAIGKYVAERKAKKEQAAAEAAEAERKKKAAATSKLERAAGEMDRWITSSAEKGEHLDLLDKWSRNNRVAFERLPEREQLTIRLMVIPKSPVSGTIAFGDWDVTVSLFSGIEYVGYDAKKARELLAAAQGRRAAPPGAAGGAAGGAKPLSQKDLALKIVGEWPNMKSVRETQAGYDKLIKVLHENGISIHWMQNAIKTHIGGSGSLIDDTASGFWGHAKKEIEASLKRTSGEAAGQKKTPAERAAELKAQKAAAAGGASGR